MKTLRRFIVAIVLFSNCVLINAQQVSTLYFLENQPYRHYINPAFQPISKMYLGLPVIGYSSIWAGNNSLTMSDIVFNQDGKTMWFLNPAADQQAFLNNLRQSTYMDVDATLNIFSFGFRIKENGYFHFNVNERLDGGVAIPKGVFNFLLGGGMTNTMADYVNGHDVFDLSQLGVNTSLYTEFAFGYSHNINEHWAIGAKLKFLYGSAYIGMKQNALELDASASDWALRGSGRIQIAAPFKLPADIAYETISDWSNNLDDEFSELGQKDIMNLVKPQGLGAGIDLGVTYKPIKNIALTASVTDLGFIRWNKGNDYQYDVDGYYDGVGEIAYSDYTDENGNLDTKALGDTVVARLENVYQTAVKPTSTDTTGFTKMTSPRLNVGIDFNFWENRVGLGAYSRTKFVDSKAYEEVTFGVAFRPVHWFQIAASYSFLNGKWSNLGAAIGLVTYEGIALTLAADYIPCYYAGLPREGQDPAYVLPYKTKGVNLAFGLNIAIGHKQNKDSDKDNILDKYDLCPNTPAGVTVDEFGCPIDTDGDGVPDYMDNCPETPQAAYGQTDEFGCPIDTDEDGVADYLDKCPDTPKEAQGLVDENGCPIDTDGDGLPDYLDACPDTPAEYISKVDSTGCYNDADGDGVPDHLDKCPDSPLGAMGYVDENGCLLDTDNDGVPDYRDHCPNTPESASVDEFGCPADSDKDGVPDYMDECPDTPEEARYAVDEKGCIKDTDGDGVPDYKDQCPTVAGVKSNNGCPEIKREVRNLLKKAMQGIQFETGKSTIKATSHPLLNQIANAFIDEPTWKVEVQGHTDNVGKADMNQKLSEDRANAVRDYLIKAGVPAEQLTAHGYGMTMPIADNKTAAGRKENRRVEFVITFEEITYEIINNTEIVTDTVTTTTVSTQEETTNQVNE